MSIEDQLRYCDRHGHKFETTDGCHWRLCLNCGADEMLEPPARGVAPVPAATAQETGDPADYTGGLDPRVGLPTDNAQRKSLPIFDGAIMYFPLALLAVAEVSRIGNEQHNPGEPLHWARGKSMDQFNTGLRHTMDHAMGARYDTDGGRHLAKAAWRALAALQLDIEAEALEAESASRSPPVA